MLPVSCKCRLACCGRRLWVVSTLFLFCCPGKVPAQFAVLSELIEGVELACQCHFIVGGMYALVTGPANENALIQFIAAEVLLKITASMDFAWNQVMKSQVNMPETQTTGRRSLVPGVGGDVIVYMVSIHIHGYACHKIITL